MLERGSADMRVRVVERGEILRTKDVRGGGRHWSLDMYPLTHVYAAVGFCFIEQELQEEEETCVTEIRDRSTLRCQKTH